LVSLYRLPKATRVEKEKFVNPGAGYYEEQSPRIKKNSPRITIGLKTETDFEKLLRKELIDLVSQIFLTRWQVRMTKTRLSKT
jgi:hypothetical protein